MSSPKTVVIVLGVTYSVSVEVPYVHGDTDLDTEALAVEKFKEDERGYLAGANREITVVG